MKATVTQITTSIRTVEVDVPDDVDFTPAAAIAVAKATGALGVSAPDVSSIYEVHDNAAEGCTVTQVRARPSTADKDTEKGGETA